MSGKSASIHTDSDYFDQDSADLLMPMPAVEPAHVMGQGGPGVGGGDGSPGVGGGGGGARLVTTYTSGNPNIDDAHEFNIQINFSGKWTPQQQAVVEWAADFYSHIITADLPDPHGILALTP